MAVVRGGAISLRTARIAVERLAAGVVEVDNTLFAALAKDAQAVAVVILQVSRPAPRYCRPQLRKITQNAIIALLVFPIHNGQQPLAFFQCEIVGEGFWYLRGVEILHRVFLQQLRFHGQVFEEAADRGDLARTRAGAQAVFRLVRIRLPDAVARR